MRILRNLVLGVVLGFVAWFLLEVSQVQWWEALNRAPVADLAIPAIGLVAVGASLAGLILLPVSPWTTGAAAVFIALLVGPLAAGTGTSWWPDGWPGSPLRLGGFSGTYLAVGVLVTVTIGRMVAIRSTSGTGPEPPSDRTPEETTASHSNASTGGGSIRG